MGPHPEAIAADTPEAAAELEPPMCLNDAVYRDWESIYQDQVVSVYRAIYARVGNRPDAEDLTEDVFTAVLRWLHLPVTVRQGRAYLASTVQSVLAEHWRQHYSTRIVPIETDLLADAGPVESSTKGRQRARRLLERLPETYRRVLELRFLRGYSVREVAGEMGMSPGNVRVTQHRALRAAAALEEER